MIYDNRCVEDSDTTQRDQKQTRQRELNTATKLSERCSSAREVSIIR